MPKELSTKHTPMWSAAAANLLKGELKIRGIRYSKLVTLLKGIDVIESERTITNKLSRGGFSFVFYLQCMKALGRATVTINLADLDVGTVSTAQPPKSETPPKQT